MVFDFSFILVVASIVTGIIWALDAWLWKPKRLSAAAAGGVAPENVREPVVVEYARSFFPVIFIVLLIRSFLFEPFRIPSDSMMPTLLGWRFHLREQVLVWIAAAGAQHEGGFGGRAASGAT